MMLKDENIKLQNPQIRRKAMKHIIVHKPHQTRCNFGLFCNTKNYKMSWFDLDSFCDSWPKDFTYFGKKKKKSQKAAHPPSLAAHRGPETSTTHRQTLPLWEMTQRLTSSSLSLWVNYRDGKLAELKETTCSLLSGRAQPFLFCRSPTRGRQRRETLVWRVNPPCVSNRGDLLSPSQRLRWNAACWNVTGSRKHDPKTENKSSFERWQICMRAACSIYSSCRTSFSIETVTYEQRNSPSCVSITF